MCSSKYLCMYWSSSLLHIKVSYYLWNSTKCKQKYVHVQFYCHQPQFSSISIQYTSIFNRNICSIVLPLLHIHPFVLLQSSLILYSYIRIFLLSCFDSHFFFLGICFLSSLFFIVPGFFFSLAYLYLCFSFPLRLFST